MRDNTRLLIHKLREMRPKRKEARHWWSSRLRHYRKVFGVTVTRERIKGM